MLNLPKARLANKGPLRFLKVHFNGVKSVLATCVMQATEKAPSSVSAQQLDIIGPQWLGAKATC